MHKYVYSFEEADYKNKKVFGGKGTSLIQITQHGLRAPPGLIVTTEACNKFYEPRKDEITQLEAVLLKNPTPKVRSD
ncbi:Phosphoenolpyruvate synthase/pyruvate phosphate dikinase [Pyrobaculum sp. WP30]|jgi:pyruvate phosphate dikinase (EC 2.7.9.1)|nr:Phosphoenolpyruvate synthase/pyruvate phosphate dikinase [Pyrobaculum sp. WP30]KUO82473.1 MAG: hypothetical protein AT707_03040 [Pyrobaculum sp. JCHS_4]